MPDIPTLIGYGFAAVLFATAGSIISVTYFLIKDEFK